MVFTLYYKQLELLSFGFLNLLLGDVLRLLQTKERLSNINQRERDHNESFEQN